MTEYEVNKEFSDALEDMMNNLEMPEFNPLREQEVQIFSLLVVKEGANGEPIQKQGAQITCVKIPPVYKALTKGDYVLLGDHHFWTHANEVQKKASLHHALMTINIEVDQKGKIKLGRRKPDVIEFRATVAHFGAWNATLLDFRDAFKQSAKEFAENVKPKA